MAIHSHMETGNLPRLRVWTRPTGPLASGSVSTCAPSVGLLGNYTLGMDPHGRSQTPMCAIRTSGQGRSGAATCLGHYGWNPDLHKCHLDPS